MNICNYTTAMRKKKVNIKMLAPPKNIMEPKNIIEPNDYYYDPFDNGLNPKLYELVGIEKSSSPLKMYKAVLIHKVLDKKIVVDFGNKFQSIYRDRTILKLYKDKEKLNEEQKSNFYRFHKKKINKKFSEFYFVFTFLM